MTEPTVVEIGAKDAELLDEAAHKAYGRPFHPDSLPLDEAFALIEALVRSYRPRQLKYSGYTLTADDGQALKAAVDKAARDLAPRIDGSLVVKIRQSPKGMLQRLKSRESPTTTLRWEP